MTTIIKEDETAPLVTLLDLLVRYRAQTQANCTDRLDAVIEVVTQLRDDARMHISAHMESKSVVEVDSMPRIVLWFESPIVYWLEQTYSVFLVSFLTTFYNPACAIGSHQAVVSDHAEIKRIQSEFGRLIKFLHRECDVIVPYFEAVWKYGDFTDLSWRFASPFKVFERLTLIWTSAVKRCNEKGGDLHEKARLYECLINSDVVLLQKGLDVPMILARMLMHYQVVRLNKLTDEVIANEREEEDDNKKEEAVVTETQ